ASHGSPQPQLVDSVSVGTIPQGSSASVYSSLQMQELTAGPYAAATADMPMTVTEEMRSAVAEAGSDRRYDTLLCTQQACVVAAEVPPQALEVTPPPAMPSAENNLTARQPQAPAFADCFVALIQGGYWLCQRAIDATNSHLAAYAVRLRPLELELFLLAQMYGIKQAIQRAVDFTKPPSPVPPAAAPFHRTPWQRHSTSSPVLELQQTLSPSLQSTASVLPLVQTPYDTGVVVQMRGRPAAAVTAMEPVGSVGSVPVGPVPAETATEVTPGKEPDIWTHGPTIQETLQGIVHATETTRDQTALAEAPIPASGGTAELLDPPPPIRTAAARMRTLTGFANTLACMISSALQGWHHASASASARLAALTGRRRRPFVLDLQLQAALTRACELHEVLASEREAVLRLRAELREGLEAVAAMARERAEAEERAARAQVQGGRVMRLGLSEYRHEAWNGQ
ncbi:hypothetical protein Vafri_12435, partial [Volvox africanus]